MRRIFFGLLVVAFSITLPLTVRKPSASGAASPLVAVTATPTQASLSQNNSTALDIERLYLELDKTKAELNDSLRDNRWLIESTIFKISVVIFAVGLIAGFLGIKTFREVDDKIIDHISKTLDREIYRVDPTMKKIFVPSTLTDVKDRLELSDLRNIQEYDDLGKVTTQGITIVHIKDKNDERLFLDFIDSYKMNLDPKRVAFILYATDNYRIDEKTYKAFKNTTMANVPVTVVSSVLAVSRGLIQ